MATNIGLKSSTDVKPPSLGLLQATVAPPPWRESLAVIRGHLLDMINPYVTQDILQGFREVETLVINEHNNITSLFEEKALPTEIREFIRSLDTGILRELEEGRGYEVTSFKEELRSLCTELAAHIESRINEIKKWTIIEDDGDTIETLSLFYGLDEIKSLPNGTLKRFELRLDRDGADVLTRFIKGEFETTTGDTTAIDSLEMKLDEKDYNLRSLIADMISSKPTQNDNIVAYWNDPSPLVGKLLRVRDSGKSLYLEGAVATAVRSGNSLEVSLKGALAPKLVVRDCLYLSATVQKTVPLRNALIAFAKDSETLEIGSKKRDKPLVRPGRYKVTQKAQERDSTASAKGGVKKFINSVFSFSLFSEQTSGAEQFDNTVCTEVTLQDITDPNHKHTLHIYQIDQEDNTSSAFVLDGNPTTMSQLDSIIVFKARTTECEYQSQDELARMVTVVERRGDHADKLRYLKEIEVDTNKIILELLGADQRDLLNELTDSLIASGVEHVDLNRAGLDLDSLARNVDDLSGRYDTHLGMQKSASEILKEIVLAANYKKLMRKEQDVEVSSTMKLLQGAVESVNTVRNKDIALFMGNTGAGKSTTVGFLLGAKLEEFENSVGDKVFRYQAGQDESRFPKIGQSIGESETLHATGYVINEQKGILDCPGFLETRGEDYELCTNLSIDEAVSRVGRIRSVVAVVPATSFTTDRGVPALQLIDVIRSRFPSAFSPPAEPGERNRFFMLITKGSNVSAAQCQNLANGKRFDKFLSEITEKISEINAEVSGQVSPFQIRALESRRRTWDTLVSMQRNGEVGVLDLQNRRERKRLMQKYMNTGGAISKEGYRKAMEDGALQRRLGACVEMSARTWEDLILKPYIDSLPNEISALKEQVKEFQRNQEEKKQSIIDIDKQCNALKEQIEGLSNLLKQGGIGNPGEAISPELKQHLDKIDAESRRMIADQVDIAQGVLVQVEAELAQEREKVEGITELMQTKKSEIEVLVAHSSGLSIGIYEDKLWKKYGKDYGKTVHGVRNWKKGRRKEVFLEGRRKTSDDLEENSYSIDLDSYDGKFSHTAFIDKKYRILPSDPKMLRQFETAMRNGKLSADIGDYRVELRGHSFECDLGAIATSAKKVRYAFKTIWKPHQPRPWIEIVHKIPNAEYNSAEIINTENRIELLQRAVDRLQQVDMIQGEENLRRLREDKTRAEQSMTDVAGRLEEITEGALQQSKEAIAEYQRNLETEILRLKERESRLGEDIERLKAKEQECQVRVLAKQREKMHLALLIVTEWKGGELLKELAEMIVGTSGRAMAASSLEEASKKSSTVEACRGFLRIYDACAEEVFRECKKELKIA